MGHDGRDGRGAPGRDFDGHDDHRGHGRPGGHDVHGPEGTEFLDLEISRVIASAAEGLARDAALELLQEAVRDRLRERLGERITRAGRIAADALADDFEANLEIEGLIATRRSQRADVNQRVRTALEEPAPRRAAKATGKGGKRSRR